MMEGVIDLFVRSKKVLIDTGYQNPHFGHWCTFKSTGYETTELSDREKEALKLAREIAKAHDLKVRVHDLSRLSTRIRYRRMRIEKTPVLFCNGVRFDQIPSRDELASLIKSGME